MCLACKFLELTATSSERMTPGLVFALLFKKLVGLRRRIECHPTLSKSLTSSITFGNSSSSIKYFWVTNQPISCLGSQLANLKWIVIRAEGMNWKGLAVVVEPLLKIPTM